MGSAQFDKMYGVITPKSRPWIILLLQQLLHDTDVTILSILGACLSHTGLSAGSAAVQQQPHKLYNSVWEPKSSPASENTELTALTNSTAHRRAPLWGLAQVLTGSGTTGGCTDLTPKAGKLSLQTRKGIQTASGK